MAEAITKEDLNGALKKFREDIRLDIRDIRVELRDFRTSTEGRFDTLESANLELLHDVKNLITELKTHHIPSLNEDRIFG